jgi:hypothetical protein
MHLKKFQLCVNHENPKIVISGLSEFIQTVLADHNCIESFGNYGKPLSNDDPVLFDNVTPQLEMKGVLKLYLDSSPKLEELFVLWNLPERDRDTELCALHMKCLAVIIHCSSSAPKYQKYVIKRILTEYISSVSLQLQSNDKNLVASTLGLLLVICKSYPDGAIEIFHQFAINSSLLENIVTGNSHNSDSVESNDSIIDTTSLVIILILTIFLKTNEWTVKNLVSQSSILHSIFESIVNFSLDQIHLLLHGLQYIDARSNQKSKLLVFIIQKSDLSHIFDLCYSSKSNKSEREEYGDDNNDEYIDKSSIQQFIIYLCQSITALFISKNSDGKLSDNKSIIQHSKILTSEMILLHRGQTYDELKIVCNIILTLQKPVLYILTFYN